jgi:hypothetical protein
MTENRFADDFETRHLNVGRSAVRELNATMAAVDQSAVQRLNAGTVQASNAAIGVANASTVELRESAIGVAAGDYVRVEDSRVLVLVAPRVSGNVHAVLTIPTAFALGAGFYVARRLYLALFGRRGD